MAKNTKPQTIDEFMSKQLELSFNKPAYEFEKNSGKRITKSAGYIPLKNQIEMLQDAGERLEMMRQGLYDFQDENQETFQQDPTRSLNFDLADGSELQRQTNDILKKQAREAFLRRKSVQMSLMNRNQDTLQKVSIGDNINKDKLSPEGGDKS